MKNYKEFLLEYYYNDQKLWKGTKALTEDEALNIIKTKCSDYFDYSLGHDRLILRYSIMGDLKFIYTNPSEYDRKSKNTFNYYTLIINNDPTWKDFPKRKLIAQHTTTENIDTYDTRTIYVIIPFNGIKWGVCTEHDMWYSIKGVEDLSQVNRDLNDIADYLEIEIRDDNLKDFKEDLKKIDLELKDANDIYDFDDFGAYVYNFKDSGNIYDYYINLLKPERNNIKVLTSRQIYELPVGDREVWTDGECLMIQLDKYLELTK